MPQSCSLCRHPRRPEIDSALLAGQSFRDIAGRFGTSKSAVERHKRACISGTLARAQGAAEVVRGDSLLERIEGALTRIKDLGLEAERLFYESQDTRDKGTALTAVCALSRESRGYIEILSRLIGTLHSPEAAAEAVGRQYGISGKEVLEALESRRLLRAMSDEELVNFVKEKYHGAITTENY